MCSGPSVSYTYNPRAQPYSAIDTPTASTKASKAANPGSALGRKLNDAEELAEENAAKAGPAADGSGPTAAQPPPYMLNVPGAGASGTGGLGLNRTAGRGIFSIADLQKTSVSSLKPGGYPKIRSGGR